ncbi:hypothetical protein J0A71_09g18930 [Encephalitozoon cuniculi]|nr:hypothetical protein J0A71_09g18930 [Encephalitozoon cuniculi]
MSRRLLLEKSEYCTSFALIYFILILTRSLMKEYFPSRKRFLSITAWRVIAFTFILGIARNVHLFIADSCFQSNLAFTWL